MLACLFYFKQTENTWVLHVSMNQLSVNLITYIPLSGMLFYLLSHLLSADDPHKPYIVWNAWEN